MLISQPTTEIIHHHKSRCSQASHSSTFSFVSNKLCSLTQLRSVFNNRDIGLSDILKGNKAENEEKGPVACLVQHVTRGNIKSSGFPSSTSLNNSIAEPKQELLHITEKTMHCSYHIGKVSKEYPYVFDHH